MLSIAEDDFHFLYQYAVNSALISNEDNLSVTKAKLEAGLRLADILQRTAKQPQLTTVTALNERSYLARTVASSDGTEYLFADIALDEVIQETEDDALDQRIAYMMGVERLLNLTDTECLKEIEAE